MYSPDDELIRLEPVEYQKARVEASKIFPGVTIHNPRILRYRYFSFNYRLTKETLEKIVKKTKMAKNVEIGDFQDRFIFYRYDDKPLIILDLVEKRVCTTKKELEHFGETTCQQQASILMRLLQKHGQASFKRITITADPERLGYTKEDREITFKALQAVLETHSRLEIQKKVKKYIDKNQYKLE